MAELLARSPIAVAAPEVELSGWLVSGRISRAGLVVVDCTPLAKVAVKASYDGPTARALGMPFGRSGSVPAGPELLVGSGPGEWLALGPVGTQEALSAWAAAVAGRVDELVTVVDLTHGRALVRLTGDDAAATLARDCAIDLAAVADGTALRTAVAGVATDVVRDDRDGIPSYLLHCERSSGQYLYEVLADAGAEFGIDVDGLRPASAGFSW